MQERTRDFSIHALNLTICTVSLHWS